MEALFSVCSEGASVDSASNLASVFNIIEEVTPEGFPFVIQRITFFALLLRRIDENAEFNATFIVRNNEAVLVQQNLAVSFQGKLRTRMVTGIQGLIVTAPGPLEFRLIHEHGEHLGAWTVTVNTPAPRANP